jgi:hypothetical protein
MIRHVCIPKAQALSLHSLAAHPVAPPADSTAVVHTHSQDVAACFHELSLLTPPQHQSLTQRQSHQGDMLSLPTACKHQAEQNRDDTTATPDLTGGAIASSTCSSCNEEHQGSKATGRLPTCCAWTAFSSLQKLQQLQLSHPCCISSLLVAVAELCDLQGLSLVQVSRNTPLRCWFACIT